MAVLADDVDGNPNMLNSTEHRNHDDAADVDRAVDAEVDSDYASYCSALNLLYYLDALPQNLD